MAAATATEPRRAQGALFSAEPDSAARRHLVVATLFLVSAGLLVMVLYLKLPFPLFLHEIPAWSYGRLRPMAINAAVFGWITLTYLGAVYYLLPRLTGAPLWGERIANANLWVAALVYPAGIVAIGLGGGQGRQFLEFPLWLDLPVLATLVVPAVIATKTVQRRREANVYVTVWYLLAGLYWMVGLYVVGNVPALGGITGHLQATFFSAGLTGLWLTGMGVGIAYYLLPVLTGNPLYSRSLALIGFWSLAFAQVWVGQADFIYGVAPDWLETVAAAMSLALVVPALAVATNFAGTLQGRWDAISESIPLRFVLTGAVGYLFVAVLVGLQGFRSVAAVVGFTSWGEGTLYATLIVVVGLWAAAFVYHAVPRLTGRRLFSARLAILHLRLTTWGGAVAAILLWAAGVVSGYAWAGGAFAGAGIGSGEGFLETVRSVYPLYTLAGIAALAVFVGQVVFVYNIVRTLTSGVPGKLEVLVPVEVGDE